MLHRPDTFTDALFIYPLYPVNFLTSFMEWFRFFFFQWRDSENREYLTISPIVYHKKCTKTSEGGGGGGVAC